MNEPFDFDVATIPIAQIPAMLAHLAALQSALAARLMTKPLPLVSEATATPDVEDRFLTVEEVAQRVRRSTKWVYRRVKNLPFARQLGPCSWVFSQRGLDKWLAR